MRALVLFSSLSLILTACTPEDATIDNLPAKLPSVIEQFDKASIIGAPSIVDCTLSGGTKTQCLSVTLPGAPTTLQVGPWCPRNIEDGPDVSGIWLESGKVYDADGEFIQNLSTFYKDSEWQMFNPESGKINVTESKVSCAAAARPDVDPQYQNHCVECQISFLEDGLSQTYVIPLMPSNAETISPRVSRSGVGVAFSGVRLDASAPTDAILSAHTLAPFDDCGGHVNLNVGYHIHAVTEKDDCFASTSVEPGHAPQIGLAMDGYTITTRLNKDGQEPKDLDLCRGHETLGLGYHYHANHPGANAIINCHKGETGCAQGDPDAACDASQSARRGPPRGERPDGPPPGNRPPPSGDE